MKLFQNDPPSIFIKNPSLYVWYYYYRILKNLCKIHHPHFYPPYTFKEYFFTLTEEKKNEWYQLFDIKDSKKEIPFTYSMENAAIPLFNCMDYYDVGFKNLYHIKVGMWLDKNHGIIKPQIKYKILIHVKDIVRIKKSKIGLIITLSVYTVEENKHIADIKHVFIIGGIEDWRLQSLPTRHPKHDPELYRNLTKKESKLDANQSHCSVKEIIVPKKMGKNFAHLTGDYNPIHTNKYIARLTGAKGAFIQGFCTFNMVLSLLPGEYIEKYNKINIIFTNTIYEGEKIYFILSDKNQYYEIQDVNKKLLAFGHLR